MTLHTTTETEAIVTHLLELQITTNGQNLYERLFQFCAADQPENSILNVGNVTLSLLRKIAWLLTIAGGQTTEGALNVIAYADIARQIDQIGMDNQ